MHNDIELVENINKWAIDNLGSNFTFRQYQKENILSIVRSVVNDTCSSKVIEAPTGSGKSIIIIVSAGVLSKYYNKTSYILCSDLFLWNQYEEFIKKNNIDFGTIKGQTGNYCCMKNGNDMKNADCRMAGIPWAQLFYANSANSCGYACASKCEYVQCRKKCMNADVVLMTYQLFLYQMNIVSADGNEQKKTFPHKDVIFCDECHNIPDIVQQKFTPTISIEVIEKMSALLGCGASMKLNCYAVVNFISESNAYRHLTSIYSRLCNESNSTNEDFKLFNEFVNVVCSLKPIANAVQDKIKHMKTTGKPLSKKDTIDFKLCTFLQNYMCYLNDFSSAISNAGIEYFLKQINIQSGSKEITSVQFHCAKEDMMVSNYLLSHAHHRIMLSATVGGQQAFSDNLGLKLLDTKDAEFSVIPSTFDFTQSEIAIDDSVRFNYANRKTALDKIQAKTYDLLKKHKGQRGIVQTGSYANAYSLLNNAPEELRSRMLMYETSKQKTELINEHKSSTDTILIGPTLCEGIDFPDDQCRFIIVMKVPYPSLADKLVQAKNKLFPTWYQSKTSNAIIQGLGRGIRHKTDWCKSYILDGCFESLINATYQQYPEEMRKRFVRV